MRTETQEVHITDDGKTFTDLDAANLHEAALENEVLLDDFVASLAKDVTERAKARMRNDILKFLSWKSTQGTVVDMKTKKSA